MAKVIVFNIISAIALLGATFIMWGNYGEESAFPYIFFGWLIYIILTNVIFGLHDKSKLAVNIMLGLQLVVVSILSFRAICFFD